MSENVKAGKWVQIHSIVLPAGERAPQAPDDTKKVALELRINGFLLEDAEVGEEVEIETYIGRKLKGILKDPDPSYEHKFGKPIAEILRIGRQVKEILKEEEEV